MITRRVWLGSAAATAAAVLLGRPLRAAGMDAPEILIYKSPTCGCCTRWVDHVRAAGFVPTVRDVADIDTTKRELGVPAALGSCHTAIVEGYLVEGHVPADVVLAMLAEKPRAAGLAVPGMPMGSPGMEGPVKDAYDVLIFQRDGSSRVYARR